MPTIRVRDNILRYPIITAIYQGRISYDDLERLEEVAHFFECPLTMAKNPYDSFAHWSSIIKNFISSKTGLNPSINKYNHCIGLERNYESMLSPMANTEYSVDFKNPRKAKELTELYKKVQNIFHLPDVKEKGIIGDLQMIQNINKTGFTWGENEFEAHILNDNELRVIYLSSCPEFHDNINPNASLYQDDGFAAHWLPLVSEITETEMKYDVIKEELECMIDYRIECLEEDATEEEELEYLGRLVGTIVSSKGDYDFKIADPEPRVPE